MDGPRGGQGGIGDASLQQAEAAEKNRETIAQGGLHPFAWQRQRNVGKSRRQNPQRQRDSRARNDGGHVPLLL